MRRDDSWRDLQILETRDQGDDRLVSRCNTYMSHGGHIWNMFFRARCPLSLLLASAGVYVSTGLTNFLGSGKILNTGLAWKTSGSITNEMFRKLKHASGIQNLWDPPPGLYYYQIVLMLHNICRSPFCPAPDNPHITEYCDSFMAE